MLIDLFALPWIGERGFAGDEVGFALHHRIDDLEVVGLERAAGLGDFDNGVGEHGRLDFSGAPAELDFDVDALGGEVALADFDQFGGDDLAFEVFGFFEAAGLGNGEHPAHFAAALLGVGEGGDAGDIEAALDDPVNAGEAGVEHAVIDVARHLLRADEHALDLAVVDGGKVGAAVGVDVPAGALEESDGGVLQAAFGDAETKFVSHWRPPDLRPRIRGRWGG